MDRINIFERDIVAFNTPLEIGFRVLFILNAIYPKDIDLNRLVIYDYFLLNSEDFPNGPKSLHPPIPHRSVQIAIKPPIMKEALMLMNSRELIDVVFSLQGILYKANALTKKFVELQENEYAENLKKIGYWLHGQFNSYTDEELNLYVHNNISNWGSEFIYESLIREQ